MKNRFGVPKAGEPAHKMAFVKGGLKSTDVAACKKAGIRTTNYFGVKGYVKPTAGASNKART